MTNTVWIYVNTSKQVGDKNHLQVFANEDAAETWLQENDPEAMRSSTRFWSEPHRMHRWLAMLLITLAVCWTPHAGR